MRKLLWGAAAIAALGAQSAHAETTGHIDLGVGYTNYDQGWDDFSSYAIGGAVQTDVAGWAVQLDGQTIMQDWTHGDGDYSHSYAAVHATSDMGSWQAGAFVGLVNWYGDGGKLVGIEGRTAMGNLSLQASAAYAAFNYNPDYDAYDARIEGSYFLSPNFALTANVGKIWASEAYGGDDDATELGVGFAYQMANGFELNGGYQHSDWSYYNGNDVTPQTLRVGFSYHFNGGSLQDETNHGASWTGAQAFTDSLSRWD